MHDYSVCSVEIASKKWYTSTYLSDRSVVPEGGLSGEREGDLNVELNTGDDARRTEAEEMPCRRIS